MQEVFRGDAALQQRLGCALDRFLGFLGLVILFGDDGEVMIARGDNFEDRVVDCWSGYMNHNWLRISRVLRCLGLVGWEAEQQALLACLEEIVEQRGFGRSSLSYWRRRAAGLTDSGNE